MGLCAGSAGGLITVLQQKFIMAEDGVKLAFAVQGEGPPLLLIPGLGGRGDFWAEALPHLRGRQLILPDHRGCGASDRPMGRYEMARLAQDMFAILEALGIENADITGHSTGGVIAQVMALQAPARVRNLVLSGTWNRPDAHFRHCFETRLDALRQAGPITYAKLTAALGFPPDWFDNATPDFAAAAADLHPLEVTAARLQMLLDYTGLPDEALAWIKRPVLILGAPDDAIIPFRHQQRLAASIPGATLAEIPGGHFFPRSRAGKFGGLVAAFLNHPASFQKDFSHASRQ